MGCSGIKQAHYLKSCSFFELKFATPQIVKANITHVRRLYVAFEMPLRKIADPKRRSYQRAKHEITFLISRFFRTLQCRI